MAFTVGDWSTVSVIIVATVVVIATMDRLHIIRIAADIDCDS